MICESTSGMKALKRITEEDVIYSRDDYMLMEVNRLASFKRWPHKEGCTKEKMAKAGFYMTSSKSDDVRCYFCLKELNQWSPEDDPWKEHLAHNSECLFAKLGIEEKDLTFSQFWQLKAERLRNLWAKRREYFTVKEKEILRKHGLSGIDTKN